MHHGKVPRTLHVDQPSPHVDWDSGAVRLAVREQAWPASDHPRRAGVSSFGIGGTIAHVILEEAPPQEREPATTRTAPAVPWLLSGAGEDALRAQAAALGALAPQPGTDVSRTLAVGRSALRHRAAVPAGDREALAALAGGERHPAVRTGLSGEHRLAVLFTGQGSQRPGMGSRLSDAFTAFGDAFTEVCDILDQHLERPLREVISGCPDLLNRTDFAQAGVFAHEVASYRLLESWGVRPDYLAGHSVGELTAAHVAGVLDLPDAAALVSARGRLMSALPAGGAMLAVEATEEEAADALRDRPGVIALAAVNGPRSVVLSGEEEAVTAVAAMFEASGRRTSRLRTSHAFHSPLIEPMLADFRAAIRDTVFRLPRIPLVSTVTGRLADADELARPEYWVSQARLPVRFADAVRALDAAGVTAYLEAGPSSALAPLVEESVAQSGRTDPEAAPVVAALSGKRTDETTAALDALSHLHVHGVPVDWDAVFDGSGIRRAELPTYPFQRKRFWLDRQASPAVDPGRLGHPLLNHAGPVPGSDRVLCWGTLSLERQPWLRDHIIGGQVVVSATTLVELATRAGAEAGCPDVEELVVHTPLVLVPSGEVLVQVMVGEPDEEGRRGVEVHACRTQDGVRQTWSQHATGTMVPHSAPSEDAALPAQWPPHDAEPVDVDSGYAELADKGMEYGPAFRNVRAAWRRGGEVFAEVALGPEWSSDAPEFGLHPALFDAALHALPIARPAQAADDAGVRVPFACNGIRLSTEGVSRVRARLWRTDGGDIRAGLYDSQGTLVAQAGSVVTRVTEPGGAAGTGTSAATLYTMDWADADSGGATAAAPALDTVVRCRTANDDSDPVTAVHAGTLEVLGVLQKWAAEQAHTGGRLVLVTQLATVADPDLAAAAVWGLALAAQAEHPDRVVLIDLDGSPESERALTTAMASGEPQSAVRHGRVLVPRLTPQPGGPRGTLDTNGTVLITGGTGSLGTLLARHLATAHGARNLLLVSRNAMTDDRLAALRAALPDGVQVRVAACDVTDGPALTRLADAAEPPLSAVVHAAGVLDDCVLEAQTPERMATVLRPKADAAWHLHEWTQRAGINDLVLFSSISGQMGIAGQANYAAANSFLDALARHRAARGLPALSLAWGPWGHGGGMAAGLKMGPLAPLSAEDGLDLFDTALGTGAAVLAPIEIDRRELNRSRTPVPAVLRGMVRAARPAARTTGGRPTGPTVQRARLTQLTPQELRVEMTNLIRTETAEILGYTDPAAMPSGRTFAELGFDSLSGVTLRNRLSAATGLRLSPSLALDLRTEERLQGHLLELLTQSRADENAAPAATVPGARRFATFYREVCASGDVAAAMDLVMAASRALPTFGVKDGRAHAVAPTRMANGPDGPALVCFPSFFPPAGIGSYGRFAPCFEGERDVFEIQYPGLTQGDHVPQDWETLISLHAETVRTHFADRPVAILGYSVGGCTAQAVTSRLVDLGHPPAALVLGDSYQVTEEARTRRWLLGLPPNRVARAGDRFEELVGDTPLAAMGAYNRMLAESWRPAEPVPVPTLLVRATEPLPDMLNGDPDRDWRPMWPQPHDTIDVPGHHEDLTHDQVHAFADAVRGWITEKYRMPQHETPQ
ncbi:type I polyketide synthase [Streptomyces sp. NPDC004610]|uniref:type I polyketide synthase n=1 Tax=unclassified Streptomyces TaxID=2593676 RepID=UPI0033A1003C